ncbi:hypothetical protein LAT59_03750 [Candidatus Gracilibacteria bacterium]|nr:hypothetical protein [Candidatus Gracilibacteria bacterium]
MLRFIVLISVIIIFLFVISQCSQEDISVGNQNEVQTFEEYIEEVFERNIITENDETIIFSLEEIFGNQSEIYKNNRDQIVLQSTLQRDFIAVIVGERETYSLQKNDEEIKQELERERRRSPSYSNSLVGRERQRQIQGASIRGGECAGLIFDPCIVIGEEVPPRGIMEFGTWRWDAPI